MIPENVVQLFPVLLPLFLYFLSIGYTTLVAGLMLWLYSQK